MALAILLGLPLLYLWLTGWWFAGVIVMLALRVLGHPTTEAWIEAAAIGLGPWLFWKVLRGLVAEERERRSAAAHQGSGGRALALRVVPDRNRGW